jgi:hypothetical protein
MPDNAWIVELVVLVVVLEAGVGRRKVTSLRLARPAVVSGAIVVPYGAW